MYHVRNMFHIQCVLNVSIPVFIYCMCAGLNSAVLFMLACTGDGYLPFFIIQCHGVRFQ